MDLIDKKLSKIFKYVLKLKKNANFENVRRISEKKWDSLAHVNIIIAVENEFKIKINASDSEKINSYKGILIFIKSKRKTK